MDASKQAKSVELISKIARLELIFRTEFPNAIMDLNPWSSDPKTQSMTDPNSIDVSFFFGDRYPGFCCHSTLVQIRFSSNLVEPTCRMIGIEVNGCTLEGKEWYFSTIADWRFEGENIPNQDVQKKMKRFSRQIFTLFRYPIHLNCS